MFSRVIVPVISLFALLSSAAAAADYMVVNANVITADRTRPHVEAFAVSDDRFSAVGSNQEVRRTASPGARVIDLNGKTVIPGINDVHLHPRPVFPESSPYYVPDLGPDSVHNMD